MMLEILECIQCYVINCTV